MLLVHQQDVATEQHTGGSQATSADGEHDGADPEEDEQCRSGGGSDEHGSEAGSDEEDEDEEDAAGEDESDEDEEQDDEEQGSEEALDSGSEDGEPGVSGAEGCTSPIAGNAAPSPEGGSGSEGPGTASPSRTDSPTSEPVPDHANICFCQ